MRTINITLMSCLILWVLGPTLTSASIFETPVQIDVTDATDAPQTKKQSAWWKQLLEVSSSPSSSSSSTEEACVPDLACQTKNKAITRATMNPVHWSLNKPVEFSFTIANDIQPESKINLAVHQVLPREEFQDIPKHVFKAFIFRDYVIEAKKNYRVTFVPPYMWSSGNYAVTLTFTNTKSEQNSFEDSLVVQLGAKADVSFDRSVKPMKLSEETDRAEGANEIFDLGIDNFQHIFGSLNSARDVCNFCTSSSGVRKRCTSLLETEFKVIEQTPSAADADDSGSESGSESDSDSDNDSGSDTGSDSENEIDGENQVVTHDEPNTETSSDVSSDTSDKPIQKNGPRDLNLPPRVREICSFGQLESDLQQLELKYVGLQAISGPDSPSNSWTYLTTQLQKSDPSIENYQIWQSSNLPILLTPHFRRRLRTAGNAMDKFFYDMNIKESVAYKKSQTLSEIRTATQQALQLPTQTDFKKRLIRKLVTADDMQKSVLAFLNPARTLQIMIRHKKTIPVDAESYKELARALRWAWDM